MSETLATPKERAKSAAGVAAKLTGSIGDNIDRMWALRERKRELEAKVKEIEGEISGVEEVLMKQLDDQGVTASRGSKATASISTSVVATIADWDALCKYIKRSGHFQLFQRRISDPAFRELAEQKGAVPGLDSFVKKKLNLKSL
jgi:hypothetical protein